MNHTFMPVVYLKAGCPFCLKLRLMLLEAGLTGSVEIRQFIPGHAEEKAVRNELESHLEKITFPAAQVAPGQFLTDSAVIIAHFATAAHLDIADC